MANTTKHTDIRARSGILEVAHLIMPRYATAPANPRDGEIWFDTTNNQIKINKEGTTYYTQLGT